MCKVETASASADSAARADGYFCSALLSFVIILVGASELRARADDLPDPRVLLQGVEDARLALASGSFDCEIVHSIPVGTKVSPRIVRLSVLFEGDNRRFDQFERILLIDGSDPIRAAAARKKFDAMCRDQESFARAGLGSLRNEHIRSAYDGTAILQYGKSLGASINDPEAGSSNYVFDPRILGISHTYTLGSTVTNSLAFR